MPEKQTGIAGLIGSLGGLNGSLGTQQVPKVDPRYYDPKLVAQQFAQIQGASRGAGAGAKNNILRMLKQRGLDRSGGVFQAPAAGVAAERGTLRSLMLPFMMGQQGFTENARQFDVGALLKLRELFLRGREIDKQPSGGIQTPFGGFSW